MNKLGYFLISIISFLMTFYMGYILFRKAELELIANALKVILLPTSLMLLFILLLIVSLYFFRKASNFGKSKKHIRFR